jgi:hypothetical protein
MKSARCFLPGLSNTPTHGGGNLARPQPTRAGLFLFCGHMRLLSWGDCSRNVFRVLGIVVRK